MSAVVATDQGRAPRVLMLANVLEQSRSGVGRWASCMLPRLARTLAERGGRLALAASADTQVPIPDEAEHVVLDLPSGPPLLRWQREGPLVARALERAAGEGRPFDWLHSAHLPLPRRIPRERVRTSWLVHDLRQLHGDLVGPSRRLVAPTLYRAAARRADLVCTVSAHVAHALVERFGRDLSHRPVVVVPNGADHLPLLPRAPDGGHPFVLGIGHLERRKNAAVVLDALALDPELPDLVWLGRGPERERLGRLARELGIEQRVTFLEGADDVDLARLLARASVCVLPSLLEGFGLVAVEALRAGTPLVHAQAGALPEVAGGHGHPFDPKDPRDLVRAIDAACEAAADGRRAAAGAAHAARFTWDRAAHLLVEAWSDRPATPARHPTDSPTLPS
jgi:glycosyltransferase involved in cell wall biosynthesis